MMEIKTMSRESNAQQIYVNVTPARMASCFGHGQANCKDISIVAHLNAYDMSSPPGQLSLNWSCNTIGAKYKQRTRP